MCALDPLRVSRHAIFPDIEVEHEFFAEIDSLRSGGRGRRWGDGDAAFTFFAGVLAAAVFLAGADAASTGAVRAMRRWDQRVTTPAMLLVWALGLTLALAGGWFTAGWLIVKLGFVVALSGLHGMQSATLRRLAGGGPAPAPSRFAAPAAIVAILVIAILAVLKPS